MKFYVYADVYVHVFNLGNSLVDVSAGVPEGPDPFDALREIPASDAASSK